MLFWGPNLCHEQAQQLFNVNFAQLEPKNSSSKKLHGCMELDLMWHQYFPNTCAAKGELARHNPFRACRDHDCKQWPVPCKEWQEWHMCDAMSQSFGLSAPNANFRSRFGFACGVTRLNGLWYSCATSPRRAPGVMSLESSLNLNAKKVIVAHQQVAAGAGCGKSVFQSSTLFVRVVCFLEGEMCFFCLQTYK